jgi:hypothetical protein
MMKARIKIDGDTPVLAPEIEEASFFFSEPDARQIIKMVEDKYSEFSWRVALHLRANRYILQGTQKSRQP